MKKMVALIVVLVVVPLHAAKADLDAGLRAFYPFNGNAKDQSNNGNDGVVNGATLTTDRLSREGSAYSFDGVDDYISIPDDNLGIAEDFTFAWWQSVASSISGINGRGQIAVFAKDDEQPDRSFDVFLRDVAGDTVDVLTSLDGSNNNSHHVRVSTSFTLNEWEHFAVVYDASLGRMELFKNGNSIGLATGGEVGINASSATFLIGRLSYRNDRFFHGLLDDIYIYNRALAASEIQEIFSLVPDGPIAPCCGYPVGFGDCVQHSLQDYHVASDYLDPDYPGPPHTGEDWNRGEGDDDEGDWVCAVGDGRIIAAESYERWSNIVVIEHQLPDGTLVWSQYAHLKNLFVDKGESVKRGQKIGAIGKQFPRRQCVTRGPKAGLFCAHLHFEIRQQYVAPDNWPGSEDTVRSEYLDPTDIARDVNPEQGFIESQN